MRPRDVLGFVFGLLVAACPPLGDDYEVGPTPDASSGGGATGGLAGAAGSDAQAGSGGSLDGAAGDAPIDASCSACDATCCNGSCVELALDPDNCGACGQACPAGRACNFGKCAAGWVAMASPPPGFSARVKAAAAWTGKALFVWGGADASGAELATGALYDPVNDSWELVPTGPNTPSARVYASALATPAGIIVWGGGDSAGTADYSDGAIYEPQKKSWSKLPNAPASRRAAIGAGTGLGALYWGGWDKSGAPLGGSLLYDSSLWDLAPSTGDPGALSDATWAVSMTDLYLFGGSSGGVDRDDVHAESLFDGSWTALAKGPSARHGAFGQWDGARFWVWGGRDAGGALQNGMSFDGSVWADLAPAAGPAPSARWQARRRSGWSARASNGVVLILGGLSVNPDTLLSDGGIYDATGAEPTWTPVPSWPSSESHEFGVGVWTGAEMVLWGGQTGSSLSLKGERFAP